MDDSAANLAAAPDAQAAPDQSGGVTPTVNSSAPSTANVGTAMPGQATMPTSGVSPSTVAPAAPSWFGQAGSWLGDQNIGGLAKDISPVIAGAGAINSIIGGTGKTPQSGAITNIASQQAATAQPLIAAGTALTNETANGQLPSAVQSQLDQQLQQQISQIQAQYAQMGLGGSTMEQQAIQAAQSRYQNDVATQLQTFMAQGVSDINSGNSDLGNAATNYGALGQEQLKQQSDMSDAIANMLKAFSGGGGSSVNIGS